MKIAIESLRDEEWTNTKTSQWQMERTNGTNKDISEETITSLKLDDPGNLSAYG